MELMYEPCERDMYGWPKIPNGFRALYAKEKPQAGDYAAFTNVDVDKNPKWMKVWHHHDVGVKHRNTTYARILTAPTGREGE